MFALSIALRVTNFPSKDCNIIAWIVPVLKMTIAFKQVNSVGSTLINLNLSMTSWSARISSIHADILSDVILLSDVTPDKLFINSINQNTEIHVIN